jgi:hypothetical protein
VHASWVRHTKVPGVRRIGKTRNRSGRGGLCADAATHWPLRRRFYTLPPATNSPRKFSASFGRRVRGGRWRTRTSDRSLVRRVLYL